MSKVKDSQESKECYVDVTLPNPFVTTCKLTKLTRCWFSAKHEIRLSKETEKLDIQFPRFAHSYERPPQWRSLAGTEGGLSLTGDGSGLSLVVEEAHCAFVFHTDIFRASFVACSGTIGAAKADGGFRCQRGYIRRSRLYLSSNFAKEIQAVECSMIRRWSTGEAFFLSRDVCVRYPLSLHAQTCPITRDSQGNTLYFGEHDDAAHAIYVLRR